MTITIILLYLLSFLLIYQFVGYPSLMAIVALKPKPKSKDYSYQQTFLTRKVLSKKQGFLLAQVFFFKRKSVV